MNRRIQNTALPNFVISYLKKYGELNHGVELRENKTFNNIIVVPAIQEYDNIKQLLLSLSNNDPKYFNESLILFVINNSIEAPEDVIIENRKTIEYIRNIMKKDSCDDGFTIGLVDASTPGKELPAKQAGVGFARKLGMDVALTLFDYHHNSKKILVCLDADCIVETNYLTAIVDSFNQMKINAATINYEHLLPEDENVKKAIVCYEIFLRYYTLGLKYANSPFAYTSIGSTIACDVETYCKAGGMNKSKAGEDFYFLEKIAKFARIYKINLTTVYPSSRESWRVPFGTGPRIKRFLKNPINEYTLYNPNIFKILKDWLEVFNSSEIKDENFYIKEANKINYELKTFLELNNFQISWKKVINNSKSSDQLQKQKLMWFDGFRTMKLVHYLRDNGISQTNMFDALDVIIKEIDNSIQIKREEEIPPIEIQMEYLKILRRLT